MQFDIIQREAVRKMRSGSILVGGVGSGKSRTGLVYYFCKECGGSMEINGEGSYSPMKNPKDLYIITTAAKRDKHEWENEFVYFLLSTNKDKCINHVSVIIDSWNNISKYEDVKNAFFIFDEQRVVGRGTWSRKFIKIAKNNHWILLSATPGDTWSDYISVFIANGFYKNVTEFCRRHIIYSRFVDYPKIERYVDTDILENFKRSILVDMNVIRNTVHHTIFLDVDYDKEKYEKVVKDRWNIFEDKPIENASQYIQTLRRIVNDDESRIKQLLYILEKHERVIVFYNYDYELFKLRKVGDSLNLITAEWNGHKHIPVPTTNKWLYLVQYNSGSEGWNCTTTNVIVFFSLNYSYRMMHQASGRIDRRDTPYSDLYYYYLKSRSGIDKAIQRALDNKKDFNERNFYEEITSQKIQSL